MLKLFKTQKDSFSYGKQILYLSALNFYQINEA